MLLVSYTDFAISQEPLHHHPLSTQALVQLSHIHIVSVAQTTAYHQSEPVGCAVVSAQDVA